MKCSECRFWGDGEDGEDGDRIYGTRRCTKAIMLWDAGTWSLAGEREDREYILKPEHESQMMFTQDGSDYRADLFTKPEFFCAHFKAMQ